MLLVKDLMTKDVFTLCEGDTLKTARNLMNMQRIRHTPVISQSGKFLGLLTHRDLLSATISQLADIDQETQDEIDSGIPIEEIMRKDVRAVPPEMSLKEAAALLLNHKYGCLPVVDDGRLVGIVTEADFLKLTISLMEALEEAE